MRFRHVDVRLTKVMSQCSVCQANPGSHSFYKIRETDDHAWFYTHDASVVDRNIERILHHMESEIQAFELASPLKAWSWCFDSHEFYMRWDTMNLSYQLLTWLTKHERKLRFIRIVRPNAMIKFVIQSIQPFLSERLQTMIQVREEDEKTSLNVA